MKGRAQSLSRIGVPVVLAILTITVFARLQDYGPESVFRRFYEASLRGDVQEIDALTVEGANDVNVGRLARGIRAYEAMGVRPQTLGLKIGRDTAELETVYTNPVSRLRVYVGWAFRLKGRTWQLSATETMASMYGFPGG